MALPLGEVKNIFAKVDVDIFYASVIVPPRFYTNLDSLTQEVANNPTNGCFMDKKYNHIATILDRIAKHDHAWHGRDQSGGMNVGTPSLAYLMKENQERGQMMVLMATNLALLTKKLTEIRSRR
ncbi:hypothetical protein HAX54_045532 [Datura stramonium]|uniref:Uncharacterized protein n=1 Tax=Datura stramonium TaxID=4076 RepID=A0ABS8SR14_DATST|nr:hypothetical protein [Datura stramonium]